MINLRILIIRKAIFSQAPKELPNKLKVLQWENYPSSSLPSNFHGTELMELYLKNATQIVQLQEPFKFQNIISLSIVGCDGLKKVPDVSAVPNLSRIRLDSCPNLVKIHDSVGSLDNLRTLGIWYCPKLREFSAWNQFKSLLELRIIACRKLGIIPFGCMRPTLEFVYFHADIVGFQSDNRSRLLQEGMDRHCSCQYCIVRLGIPRCFRYRSNKNFISFWIQKTLPDIHVSFVLKCSNQASNDLSLWLRIGPLELFCKVHISFKHGTQIFLLPRVLPYKDHHKIQSMLTRLDYWVPVDVSLVRMAEYRSPEITDRNEGLNASVGSNAVVEECGIYVSPTCDANFSFVDPYS